MKIVRKNDLRRKLTFSDLKMGDTFQLVDVVAYKRNFTYMRSYNSRTTGPSDSVNLNTGMTYSFGSHKRVKRVEVACQVTEIS